MIAKIAAEKVAAPAAPEVPTEATKVRSTLAADPSSTDFAVFFRNIRIRCYIERSW